MGVGIFVLYLGAFYIKLTPLLVKNNNIGVKFKLIMHCIFLAFHYFLYWRPFLGNVNEIIQLFAYKFAASR